jgi:hypothetical protein
MKTNRFLQLTAALVLAITLTLSLGGCGGGDDPKSLAKQGAELLKKSSEQLKLGKKPGDPEYDALYKKSEEFGKKVDGLSEADKKIYHDELSNLMAK